MKLEVWQLFFNFLKSSSNSLSDSLCLTPRNLNVALILLYLVLIESTSFPVFSDISVHNGSSVIRFLVTLLGFPTNPFHFLFVWLHWNLHAWSVSEITVRHGSSVFRFSQIQLFLNPFWRYSPRQSRIKQPPPQASPQDNPAAAGPAQDHYRLFMEILWWGL